jgi:hypothetical protein
MSRNDERTARRGWSWWNPLYLIISITNAWRRGERDSRSSNVPNRSSGSRTRSSRSSRTTLYGQEYRLSAELTGFLMVNNNPNRARIPEEIIVTALQATAHDNERRRAARRLSEDSSQELACLLQAVCFFFCYAKRGLLTVLLRAAPRLATEGPCESRRDFEASPGCL